jgi:hypothetical protein
MGNMLFGPVLPFKTLQILAKILRSPAYLFILKEVDASTSKSIHHDGNPWKKWLLQRFLDGEN